jgi:hypothetical protein
MAEGRLISYLGAGPLASRPADPTIAADGLAFWLDEDTGIISAWDGTSWRSPQSPAPVVPDATTARDATVVNAGTYVRFTNEGAKTFTFNDYESYEIGAEYYAENVGAGDLTLVEGGYMLLHPPLGGSLVVPQDGVVCIKIVAADEAKVIGNTDPGVT